MKDLTFSHAPCYILPVVLALALVGLARAQGTAFKLTADAEGDEGTTLNAIIPDFQVNENVGGEGTGYDIWANVLDWAHPVGISDDGAAQTVFILHQNYPNPFHSSTTISYSLRESGFVILEIYDLLGREIHTLVNAFQKAQVYTARFNANDLASGIYFYKIHVGGNVVKTKKMVLLR